MPEVKGLNLSKLSFLPGGAVVASCLPNLTIPKCFWSGSILDGFVPLDGITLEKN
jgi:hypothetical protein